MLCDVLTDKTSMNDVYAITGDFLPQPVHTTEQEVEVTTAAKPSCSRYQPVPVQRCASISSPTYFPHPCCDSSYPEAPSRRALMTRSTGFRHASRRAGAQHGSHRADKTKGGIPCVHTLSRGSSESTSQRRPAIQVSERSVVPVGSTVGRAPPVRNLRGAKRDVQQ